MGSVITIAAPAGAAEAYLTGEPGRPGVLLHVDAIGLRAQIHRMADRIASWGCTVLVPHVFYRDGSAAELAPSGDLREAGAREAFFASGVMERIGALTPELAARDAEAWLDRLDQHAGPGPVGTVGYCMGAGLAVRSGTQFPERVAAVGGFHGARLAGDGPDSPHLGIASATASYAFGHADQDPSMPPAMVEVLGETLAATGRPFTNEVYAGAPHGYSMADTSMYDAGAAERHFGALQGLFAATLGAAPA